MVPDGVRSDAAVAIVLAAGEGKRMRSDLPKVLHQVGGRPMLVRVLLAAAQAGLGSAVVVTGHGAPAVEAAVRDAGPALAPLRCVTARQARQRGTGDAAACGLAAAQGAAAGGDQSVLILPGDAPLLGADALRAVLAAHARHPGITLYSARLPDPSGYGRIVRDAHGAVAAIVEERDATVAQRGIDEVFTLVACYRRSLLETLLPACRAENAQGEIYLTDTVALARARGEAVTAVLADQADDALGVNDRLALARAEAILRQRMAMRRMAEGVTIRDPASTWVDERAIFGPDTLLLPGCSIEGPCVIGARCVIGPGAVLRDCRLGSDCTVVDSVLEGVTAESGARIGPHRHLRRADAGVG